jgi:hypothetical protein
MADGDRTLQLVREQLPILAQNGHAVVTQRCPGLHPLRQTLNVSHGRRRQL